VGPKAWFDPNSSWRGLTLQLFLIIILPLTALLLAITFGSLSLHQNAMRMLVGERDERAVRAAARALGEQIKHRMSAIQGLAQRAGNNAPDELDAILTSSSYLLGDFDSGLAFFNRERSLHTLPGGEDFWENQVAWITPLLGDLVKPGGVPAFLSPSFSRPHGGESLVLIVAASPDGKWFAIGGFSAAALAKDTLDEAVSGDQHAVAVLVDRDGSLIYQRGVFSDGGDISAHPGVQEALRGESGTDYIQAADGEHVVAFSPVSASGWALVVEEPWEMVSTPSLRATQIAPLVLVPVLLLALLALWFGVRQGVQPLQALEARSADLAWGNFEAIQQPVGGILEIRRLQIELVHLAQKVQAAQQGLRGYIGAMTAAQEEERRRLARELHDDTIQALIALKQRVQLAQMDMKDEPSARSLAELSGLTEQTIENLRRLTSALRPIYLEDLGLVTALEMLSREAGQAMRLQIEFHKDGLERRLPAAAELAIYRIAQEALNNVARHAQASAASLTFSFLPGEVVLEVSDNGKGFEVPKSPAEFAPSGHFGLLGLYERAELIGASLKIQSTPGEGTRLSVHLPTPEQ